MTNEPTKPGQDQENPNQESEGNAEAGVATKDQSEAGEEEKERINQAVDIADVGPCKKHIKVTVDRSSIDELFRDKFTELMKETVVPGFRKGKAPRKVIEKLYHKEVGEQIKGQLLMASLEQLAEENDIAPISPPDLNPNKIEIPKTGSLVYEFDVEVRPEFDVPEYKGLKLKRPVRQFTAEDVAREERRLLSPYGQMVPKDGPVERDDFVIVDMTTRWENRVIGSAKELTLRVDDRLAFRDGVAEKFAQQVVGARANDTRVVDVTLGSKVANPLLHGKTVDATLEIKDVKTMRLPELTHEFLHNFGVHSEGEFRDEVHKLLERRLAYTQRQSAREQILQHFVQASQWELPRDLLVRQARRSMNRRAMEMRESGMSDQEIEGQLRLMQQDIVQSTELSLKEHFVLQKIAELEEFDVDEEEINAEIEAMAEESGESPRRVRAQLEKDQALDTLAALIIERKALDLILSQAEYEEVPLDQPQPAVAVSEEQAVEGELRDPVAEAQAKQEEEKKEAEEKEKEKESGGK
jgi:trigger factor